MGYSPNYVAKSLVSKKTSTIGVVVPEIAHSFFSEAIQGIESITFNDDYQLILTHSAEQKDREKKALETLKAKRVDGILISSAQTVSDYSIYQKIVNSDTKLVFFDRCVPHIGASCIRVDDRTGSYNITKHLLEHGYRRLAYLGGPLSVSISQQRLEGYKEALRSENIPVIEEWIMEAGFHEQESYEAMKAILNNSEEPPRAVVAVNDPVAFGAMNAIYELGYRIPEDIAIVGFSNDIRAPLMKSPLTTVIQPAYDLGKRAAQKLISLIENNDEPPENIELLTSLKIRNSCGCG